MVRGLWGRSDGPPLGAGAVGVEDQNGGGEGGSGVRGGDGCLVVVEVGQECD